MSDKKDSSSVKFKTSIGGQALIEGIMMLGPEKRAIVCRGSGEMVEKSRESNAAQGKKSRTRASSYPRSCSFYLVYGKRR